MLVLSLKDNYEIKKIATVWIIIPLFATVVTLSMKIYCHALLFTVGSERERERERELTLIESPKAITEVLRTSIKTKHGAWNLYNNLNKHSANIN